jgi:glutathione peroxidase
VLDPAASRSDPSTITSPIYDFSVRTLEGRESTLAAYRGRVLLIVNVASRCGFTPQYAGLEALWQRYRDRGFVVLGFPCNQFAAQEPGTEAEIGAFCSSTYQVSFPMFAKVEVNGDAAHPLYRWLQHQAPGVLGTEAIKWNFTKFLVDGSGVVIARFAPATTPEAIEKHVLAELQKADS